MMRCMQRLLRFRMGCHKLPGYTGCCLRVPGLNKICTLCQQGILGDEKHIVFECPALQDLRDRYANLFQAPQGDAMILFVWQDDVVGVARFSDACLESVYTSFGIMSLLLQGWRCTCFSCHCFWIRQTVYSNFLHKDPGWIRSLLSKAKPLSFRFCGDYFFHGA